MSLKRRFRIGVVGAGHMGQIHARVIARLISREEMFNLGPIFDHHEGRADALAKELGSTSAPSLEELAEQVDLAIVAVPTTAHLETAKFLLDSGIDLLVEKPLAQTPEEGLALAEAARRTNRIIQVGHVEWFNPRWRAAAERVGEIQRIDVQRLQPRSERGRDVDVIQDLMLHDLDWTSRLLSTELTEIIPGEPVAGRDRRDAVSVELRFESKVRVHLTVDRDAGEKKREARFEGSSGVVIADLALSNQGVAAEPDPLEMQWRDFVRAVESRQPPENSVDVGVNALRIAERVRSVVRAGLIETAPHHDGDWNS